MLPWWEQVNPLIIPPGEPPLRRHRPGCQRPVAEVAALVDVEVGIRAHHLLLDAIGGFLQKGLRGAATGPVYSCT